MYKMFGNDKERTPAQKAQRAQLGIFARLAGCGYLIYIMVKMLRSPSEDTSPVFMTIIAIVMLALSAFVIVITIREFFIGLKAGRYSAATYYEEDLDEYMKNKVSEEDGKEPEQIGEAGTESGNEDSIDGEDDETKDNNNTPE